jgi:hypothetical protein
VDGGQGLSYPLEPTTEDRAKIDFSFLFGISGFPSIRPPIRVAVLRGFWRVLWAETA